MRPQGPATTRWWWSGALFWVSLFLFAQKKKILKDSKHFQTIANCSTWMYSIIVVFLIMQECLLSKDGHWPHIFFSLTHIEHSPNLCAWVRMATGHTFFSHTYRNSPNLCAWVRMATGYTFFSDTYRTLTQPLRLSKDGQWPHIFFLTHIEHSPNLCAWVRMATGHTFFLTHIEHSPNLCTRYSIFCTGERSEITPPWWLDAYLYFFHTIPSVSHSIQWHHLLNKCFLLLCRGGYFSLHNRE